MKNDFMQKIYDHGFIYFFDFVRFKEQMNIY